MSTRPTRRAALATIAVIASLVIVGAATADAPSPDPATVVRVLRTLGLRPRATDQGFRVAAPSMEPTLRCAAPGPGCTARVADRILVRPFAGRAVARGDIIAFTAPPLARSRCGNGGIFIQRAVAAPGDRWAEKNGLVYLNGKRLAEPYVAHSNRDARTFTELRVPRGRYFLMGDNRASTCDSRVWGMLPARAVLGRVTAIYWPASRARRL